MLRRFGPAAWSRRTCRIDEDLLEDRCDGPRSRDVHANLIGVYGCLSPAPPVSRRSDTVTSLCPRTQLALGLSRLGFAFLPVATFFQTPVLPPTESALSIESGCALTSCSLDAFSTCVHSGPSGGDREYARCLRCPRSSGSASHSLLEASLRLVGELSRFLLGLLLEIGSRFLRFRRSLVGHLLCFVREVHGDLPCAGIGSCFHSDGAAGGRGSNNTALERIVQILKETPVACLGGDDHRVAARVHHGRQPVSGRTRSRFPATRTPGCSWFRPYRRCGRIPLIHGGTARRQGSRRPHHGLNARCAGPHDGARIPSVGRAVAPNTSPRLQKVFPSTRAVTASRRVLPPSLSRPRATLREPHDRRSRRN